MQYIDYLTKQPSDKDAIIINGDRYTYGKLYVLVQDARARLPQVAEKHLYPIRETGILKQLVLFLACAGTNQVPVIVPADSKLEVTDPLFDTPVPERAVMAVMTSGTTGIPKILFRSFESWADFFAIQNAVFGVDADSRLFVQGSLAFTGNLNLYMGQLAAGGTLIAEDVFLPGKWEQAMARERANGIYLIPSKLLMLPRVFKGVNANIRTIISGSQSLGRKDAEVLKKIFPNTEITLYYGASELNYITYVKSADMTEERNLIGKPFPGVRVFIQDDEMYVDNAFHVENITVPYSLKDSGRMDLQGNFYFLGRTDDIVGVRGRKVSMMKIENALEEVAGITEAAVVLLPKEKDADMPAEIVSAFVTVEGTDVPENLRQQLKEKLADFEIPKRVIVLEAFPKNTSGKVDKARLKKMWIEQEPQ